MPVVGTKGAMSSQGFGEFAQASTVANYIEEVFSTYLYTGNGSTQAITNGIDLSTKGGLVWIKNRLAAESHQLFDTARGLYKNLNTNNTSQQFDQNPNGVSAFNTNGFSVTGTSPSWNQNGSTQASWTFRKQPKFFDIVTYTGDGANRTISHNLGSVPGCIIVKRTDSTSNWQVYHNGLTSAAYLIQLNSTNAEVSSPTIWNSTAPTSTVFSLGTSATVNASGGTFVAYLFASNAGGFGLTGSDNVISCGSFTGSSTPSATTLGFEPQWILYKQSNGVAQWNVVDNIRGFPTITSEVSGTSYAQGLYPNSTAAEGIRDDMGADATGFSTQGNSAANTYIYIAIRRGPMKVPTSGTSVFIPLALNNAADTKNTTGFPVDLQFQKYRAGLNGIAWFDRLRGLSSVPSSQSATTGLLLRSSSTAAEVSTDNLGTQYGNTSFNTGGANGGIGMIYWNVRRAAGFMDAVCYSGTGSATTQAHNLGVAPELMIVKRRSAAGNWVVYSANLGNATQLLLDSTSASSASSAWNSTTPTSTVFSIGTASTVNSSGITYVAYLFATCAGVSKVGRYSGTGSAQTINCGFTTGARFVLIKRDNSASTNWYVWDSARGITSSNDPFLWLNATDAENTSTNYVDTDSTGFKLTASAPSQLNASGGTYIFLAIA